MFARGRWLGIVFVALAAACSSGSGGNGGNDLRLFIQLLKGKVSFGDLVAYELHDTGAYGRMVGDGQADADGNATLTLNGVQTRFVLVTGSGGTIDDPFSGQQTTIPANYPLCAIVDTTGDLNFRYQLNPWTTMVSKRTEQLAREADVGLEDAYLNADLNFRNKFGVPTMIGGITGRDVTQPQSEIDGGTELGLFTAALCEYAVGNGRNPFELVWLLGTDARDGMLDAHYNDTPIKWSLGDELDTDIWTLRLGASYSSFRDSALNVNSYTDDDTGLDEVFTLGEDLERVPAFTRLWPRWIEAGSTNGFDIDGSDLPDVGDVAIRIGGVDVDAGDVTDNGAGGYRVQLGVDFTDRLTLSFGARYDLEVADRNTGQYKVDRDAIGLVLPDQEPRIDADHSDYPFVDAFGGGAVSVYGWNFKPTTQFTIGGQPAEVAEASFPGVVRLVVPRLTEGTHDLQASDAGGQSTVPNLFTALNKGASNAVAGSDLRPELVYGARYQFGDDKVTTFDARIDYTDAGSGSYQYSATEVGAINPIPQDVTDSGQAFTADQGLEKETLLFGGINLFYRGNWNGDFGAALGPNTQIGLIKEPAGDVTPQQTAGIYNTVILRWNFGTLEWQQMNGTIELRDDGSGSLNVNCRTMSGSTDFEQPLSVGFTIELGAKGRWTITSSVPGFDFDLEGQTDADASVHYFRGTQDQWVTWGVAGRVTGSWDAVKGSGAYVGPRARLRTDTGSATAEYGRVRMTLESLGGQLEGIRFDEGVDADDSSPDGDFRWNTNDALKVPTLGGRYLDRNGEPRGFFAADGALLVGSPGKGATGADLYVDMPRIKTGRSLGENEQYQGMQGRYYGANATSGGVDNWSQIGKVQYVSPRISGFQYGASYSPSSNETKHTRRLGDGTVQNAVFSDEFFDIGARLQVVGVYDRLYRYADSDVTDSDSPYFGQTAPFLQGVGNTQWGVTTWTNGGTPGIQYVSLEAGIPESPAASMPDGRWRTSTFGSDLTGGMLQLDAAKLEYEFSSGTASVTGLDRIEFENDTSSTGTVSGTGQVSGFDADGFFTETDSSGTDWRGFLFNDNKAFWKIAVGADFSQDLGIGVLESGSTPEPCNRWGFRVIQGFDAPNESFITILPIAVTFEVPNAERGTGSLFYLPFDAMQPIPFPYFSDNVASTDATGGFTVTDQTGTSSGGLSSDGGASVVSPGDADEDLFELRLQFQLLF